VDAPLACQDMLTADDARAVEAAYQAILDASIAASESGDFEAVRLMRIDDVCGRAMTQSLVWIFVACKISVPLR
jgi:hypothetical protein